MRKRLIVVMATVTLGTSIVGLAQPAVAAQEVGPSLTDFIDINQVPPGNTGVRAGRGSFTARCGRNENGHRNSDNHIVAPGVSNGAHHVHDYVGNLTTDGFSTDQSLAAGGTTCQGDDKSAYFWPVLRSRPDLLVGANANQGNNDNNRRGNRNRRGVNNQQAAGADQAAAGDPAAATDPGAGTDTATPSASPTAAAADPAAAAAAGDPAADAADPAGAAEAAQAAAAAEAGELGGAADGNIGKIIQARSVQLEFRGNPTGKVVAMPKFLRVITGDAKAATNGTANARAQWSCTGFTNRVTTKYPLCPRGSQVVRTLDFPSCWDGQNTDSANHRTHVVFPDASGACAAGTQAIPQLRMTLVYSVPSGPSFAVDAFPEQLHNPVTDHADFHNVMSERLMGTVVDCINQGRRC